MKNADSRMIENSDGNDQGHEGLRILARIIARYHRNRILAEGRGKPSQSPSKGDTDTDDSGNE